MFFFSTHSLSIVVSPLGGVGGGSVGSGGGATVKTSAGSPLGTGKRDVRIECCSCSI